MLKLKLQYFGHLMGRADHWKRRWCWERLKAGGEGDDSGWDGWMASLTQWTWVWVNSGSWWWTGRPGVLRFMGSRRVDSLEKTLMLGEIEGRRRRRRLRMRWLDGITDSMDVSCVDSGRWWWTGRPGVLRFMGLQRVGHDWATELNWTDDYFFKSRKIVK